MIIIPMPMRGGGGGGPPPTLLEILITLLVVLVVVWAGATLILWGMESSDDPAKCARYPDIYKCRSLTEILKDQWAVIQRMKI